MSRCISKLCEFNGCRFPQACPIASFGDITEAVAPAPDTPAARQTSFALAAELLETAVWLSQRTALPDNRRHLEVLQRTVAFLRGDMRGEVVDVRHLIRNDAACAAIAAYVRRVPVEGER